MPKATFPRERGEDMKDILVMDDDFQFRQVLKLRLEEAGYKVHDAGDGINGMRLLSAEPIGLVITDIIMPGKEGIEPIREIRHDYPDVKIIAISGGGRINGECYLRTAKRLGADRTFTKPFKREELLAAIQELLDTPAPATS